MATCPARLSRQHTPALPCPATQPAVLPPGQELGQGPSRVDSSRNSFMGKVVKHWKGLPREVVELPSLEVSREGLDVALRALGMDLMILEIFSSLGDAGGF